jgi:hypothetical protein
MGEVVLDAGSNSGDLHVYAHCLRGRPGGVALAAINLSRTTPAQLNLPIGSQRYTLAADTLQSTSATLNGSKLALTRSGELPALKGAPSKAGMLALAPESITFLAIPAARNRACQ